MPDERPTYAKSSRTLVHRSYFRIGLEKKAHPVPPGQDPVHEYLVDQANLRGYHGAFSNRSDLGAEDPELNLEEIVIGLLHPAAPAEARVLKLVVRILQSGRLDHRRLHLLARRERALATLAWLIEKIPAEERTSSIEELEALLEEQPPRERRRPALKYDPSRLLRRKGKTRLRSRSQ